MDQLKILSLQESYIGGIRSLTSSLSFKRGEHAHLLASWNPVLDLWPILLFWFTDNVTHNIHYWPWMERIHLRKTRPCSCLIHHASHGRLNSARTHSPFNRYTNLRATLPWGAALNYGDERPLTGMSLVLCSFAYWPQHRSAASFDKWRMRKIDYFFSAYRIQRRARFGWFTVTKLES